MPKKSISSVELAALVHEMQFILKGKISQVYHPQEKELLLQLHVPHKGKQLLKILVGKLLCITEEKEVPLKPSSFCMQLRKYIEGAFINAFYQQEAERVVVFELDKKEKYRLIIELFSKGNIILTGPEGKIIAVEEEQLWKDRAVKAKEKYIFPKSEHSWKTISEKELGMALQKSEKRNLATMLATEIGLGGAYAEEVCHNSGIDKEKKPVAVSMEEVKLLGKAILRIRELVKKPQGYLYEEEVTPFPLQRQKAKRETKTYSEAIDTLNPFQITSPYVQRIKALEKTIADQEEGIHRHEETILLNKKKGERIYEHYVPLRKLLDIVAEMRKTKKWDEIERELRKEKKIKAVDLKTKKIIIDL